MRPKRGAMPAPQYNSACFSQFQCTCPVRGTTDMRKIVIVEAIFQFTCPVRGTTAFSNYINVTSSFQFTCPMGGTTDCPAVFQRTDHISMYVPHAGHNYVHGNATSTFFVISMYAPHTGALAVTDSLTSTHTSPFQCTCPVWGTTASPHR